MNTATYTEPLPTVKHVFKSRYGQCSCLWCGRGSPISDGNCFVDAETRRAVAKFAKEHGRTWKAALRHLWTVGKDSGPLRRARNAIGPRNLDRITAKMLASREQLIDRRQIWTKGPLEEIELRAEREFLVGDLRTLAAGELLDNVINRMDEIDHRLAEIESASTTKDQTP